MPGLSLAIAAGGRIAYAKGFGWANLEDRTRVNTGTLFPAASTVKLLTATAVLQLAERGRLDLDRPIETYCPAFPRPPRPVTVAQLLVHQGGIRPTTGAEVFNREHYTSVAEAVATFARDGLVAEPGTQDIYTNLGYVLLACAIEGASGSTYDDYLQRGVLNPAGMTATVRDDFYRVIPHRAAGYMVRTADNTRDWGGLWTGAHLAATRIGEPFRADPVDASLQPGAGNYLTTPSDLARFVIALYSGALLGDSMRQRMFTAHPTADCKSTTRGFGWSITAVGRRKVARVIGSVWAGSSAVLALPEDSFAVVVSTNLGFHQPSELLERLARVWGRTGED